MNSSWVVSQAWSGEEAEDGHEKGQGQDPGWGAQAGGPCAWDAAKTPAARRSSCRRELSFWLHLSSLL